MQKKFCIVLSWTLICYWAESSPVGLGTLKFDKLDTDLDDLTYEINDEDLNDFTKLLDYDDATKNASEDNKAKTSVKTTGFKKKNTAKKGLQGKHNIEDLKKFYKAAGVRDKGAYDDQDTYAITEGIAAQAVGVKGNEDRKYRKGTKTRGFHRVQHKDEYKKDQVFYEDDETSGTIKKVGAKDFGYKVGGGKKSRKGNFNFERQKGIYGKQGYLDKGSLDKQLKAYADAQGFDATFNSES